MSEIWLPSLKKDVHPRYGFPYAPAVYAGKPWMLRQNPVGILHSTEGTTLPGYNSGASNPNVTLDPWRKKGYQHLPLNVAARATRNNNHAGVQIEIIGYCDERTALRHKNHEFFLPNLPQDGKVWLALRLAEIGKALGIPATTSVKWLPYPASAEDNGVRLSVSALEKTRGWIGHQHMPAPDVHGDPGLIGKELVNLMASNAPKTTKPAPAKAPKATPFLLPAGHWYGVNDMTNYSHSGVRSVTDARNVAKIQGAVGQVKDGIFGLKTKEAVRKFQNSKKLVADGKVGPLTWKALGI